MSSDRKRQKAYLSRKLARNVIFKEIQEKHKIYILKKNPYYKLYRNHEDMKKKGNNF